MTLRVGTSGWSYPEWQPAFYPKGLPRSQFLQHYASVFDVCEINATFYRLQSEKAVTSWRSVGKGLRYVCKVHRGITHARAADPGLDGDLPERFVKSLAPLSDAHAGVLAQLPPYRRRDDGFLSTLLERLAPVGPVVVEFRHASWVCDEVAQLVADAHGTVCYAHTEGPPPGALPPGRVAYVRLRADHYDDADRGRWRDLLVTEAAKRDVFAIAKHKDLPADDPHSGLGFARWLTTSLDATP